jgi:hypothetical protein
MSYSTQEVMRCLSLREFTALCNLVDEFGPERQMIGNGGQTYISGELRTKKFSVERIERLPEKIRVLLNFGQGDVRRVELPLDGKRGASVRDICNGFKEAA